MHPRRILSFAATVIPAAALTLLPGEARAQPHGGHGHVSVGVGIGVGYGYPVYAAPYFYNPYWWGFYGGFSTGFWGYPSFAYPPYPYPGYGYFDASADLRVQVVPRTAEVYVDGYLVGTVDDFDGVFQRVHMPLGEHQITIYSPGHRSITERMLFRPFESYKIKDTLQPLPAGEADEARPAPSPAPPRPQGSPRGGAPMEGPPPESGNQVQLQLQQGDQHFGAVAVRVQPTDAEILIDGERWEAPAGERVQVQLTSGIPSRRSQEVRVQDLLVKRRGPQRSDRDRERQPLAAITPCGCIFARASEYTPMTPPKIPRRRFMQGIASVAADVRTSEGWVRYGREAECDNRASGSR